MIGWRSERGAAAVEFALVVPVLLALLLGIIEFGRAYNLQISLTHAARESARYMAIHEEWDEAMEQGILAAPAAALEDSHFVLTPKSCGELPNAEVVVTYPLETITGIGDGLTIRGKAAMRCGG
jgi:Flp pilus assembly protein TadG